MPCAERLVAQPTVDRVDPGVLPRRAGIGKKRTGPGESAPIVDGLGYELDTVLSTRTWYSSLVAR